MNLTPHEPQYRRTRNGCGDDDLTQRQHHDAVTDRQLTYRQLARDDAGVTGAAAVDDIDSGTDHTEPGTSHPLTERQIADTGTVSTRGADIGSAVSETLPEVRRGALAPLVDVARTRLVWPLALVGAGLPGSRPGRGFTGGGASVPGITGGPTGVVVDPALSAADREALFDSVRRTELRRMRREGGPRRPDGGRWVGGYVAAVAGLSMLIFVLRTLLASLGLKGNGVGDLTVGLVLATVMAVVCVLGHRAEVARAEESARLLNAFVEEDEIHPDDRPLLAAARTAIRSVLASRAIATDTLDTAAVRMALAEEEWKLARHLAALGTIRTVLTPADGSDTVPAEPTPAISAALAEIQTGLTGSVVALQDYAAAVDALDDRLFAVVLAEHEAATRRSGQEAAERAGADARLALTELRARLAGDRVVDQLRQLASDVEAARRAIPPPHRGPDTESGLV